MSQHILKNPGVDLGSMEREIQRRLRWGKAKLLLSHIFCFLLASAVIFFMI